MKNSAKIGRKYVNILGIRVIGTSERELLTAIEEKITHNRKFFIATPNPELILASMRNYRLRQALNSADFAVPDAIGLSQAAKYLSLSATRNPIVRPFVVFFQGLIVGAATFVNPDWLASELKPIKGRILFVKLIELANKKGWKVFLLGGVGNEAVKTAEKLRISHKKVKIETFAGPMVDDNANPVSTEDRKLQIEAIARINRFKPQLLFVAMKNPKQEIWIHKNLKRLNVGGAMTVGGTFRYVAGMSKLPPKWMEKAGLEWIWRLITEPHRFRRILNAFPIFPLRVFWFKVTGR